MTIHEIASAGQFDKEVMKSDGLSIVKFWAPWCGPCIAMNKPFEESAKHFSNNPGVRFFSFNIDSDKVIGQTYRITSIPCLMIFLNGKDIAKEIGTRDQSQIVSLVGSHLEVSHKN